MQAVILAGGFGTRLSHIVSDVPKPMAPINNIPFLKYIYDTLTVQGFDEFIFLTGYKSECIEEYFKDYKNITFIKEEKPLGTGGAVLNAFPKLKNEFFIINGDTFFDIDYSVISDFAKDKQSLLALRFSDNIERYGFVEIDANYKVTKFIEKGNLPSNLADGYINGGIYYFKKEVLEKFYNNFNEQFISMENEIFPELINSEELYALPTGGCFIDIGIPEDYYRAQTLIPEWLKKETKPALFVDKDGTLIVNTEYPHGKNIQIIENTIAKVEEYSKKNYYIIMITNQAGIAKNKFTFEQMEENFTAIKEYYSKHNIEFDDIEYCPYHTNGVIKEFAKKSLCRKPEAGMILKACEKLKIDIKNSIMIGDNPNIDYIKLPYLKCEILKEEKCL